MAELTEACQPVYVHTYGLDRETWEQLFDRVAEAAHALDESVSCSGGNVCALCVEEPTREELVAEVDRLRVELETKSVVHQCCEDVQALRTELAAGDASDGFHTHKELYESRLLLHAHATPAWLAKGWKVVKSRYHHDGELCYDGAYFIVVAELPTGQISFHYANADWNLFTVPEVPLPPEWDGHSPAEAAQRLRDALLLPAAEGA